MIRKVKPKDKIKWQELYRSYANFYKVEMNDRILEIVWGWLHDNNHDLNGIVFEIKGSIVAFAHYRRMPRPLKGKYIGFLDDLFVESKHRNKKIGEKLINELKKISDSKEWNLIRWITKDDNLKAKKLYDKIAKKTSWDLYELK